MPIDPRTRDSVHAFKFEEFQETEIGENKKFLSQSMPPSKPSCLAKKSGGNKKWDTCSGNDGSWMKSVNRKTQPTSTWKKKHISIYKSSFRSNFATHFLKIKKNPMGTIWNDETIHWFQRYSTWTTKPWRISTSSDLNESPRRDLDRLFQFHQPPWAGHQCSKKSATWKQKSVKKTNKYAVLVVVCLILERVDFLFVNLPWIRNLIMQKSANNLFIDADSLGLLFAFSLLCNEILKLLSVAIFF